LYYTLPKLGLDAVQVFIVAVVISDSIYWLIRCPAETMKTRLQTKADSDPIQSFQNIIQQGGVKGFYKGYIPLMQLDLPFTAINFSIYSAYKAFIEMSQGHDPTAVKTPPSPNPSQPPFSLCPSRPQACHILPAHGVVRKTTLLTLLVLAQGRFSYFLAHSTWFLRRPTFLWAASSLLLLRRALLPR